MKKIRVLIVEDSPTQRILVKKLLQSDPEIEIVGEAADGETAVKLAEELKPDVILLDLQLPGIDGLEVIKRVMASNPTPILVLSSVVNKTEKYSSMEALRRGAVDVMEKPSIEKGQSWMQIASEIIKHVKEVSKVLVVPHVDFKGLETIPIKKPKELPDHEYEVVAIGASTGGPKLINQILSSLPEDYPIPVLIVQHIAPGFDEGFAEWLDKTVPMKVKLAENGEPVKPATAYVAPVGFHMKVSPNREIVLDDGSPVNNQKPSADILFESVAEVYMNRGIGVILSGMGRDGAVGLKKMKDHGARVFALRAEECVVFGMPSAALEVGAVDRTSSLSEIIEFLVEAGKILKK